MEIDDKKGIRKNWWRPLWSDPNSNLKTLPDKNDPFENFVAHAYHIHCSEFYLKKRKGTKDIILNMYDNYDLQINYALRIHEKCNKILKRT